MYTGKPSPERRIGAGLGTALVVGLIGWALLLSLANARRPQVEDALTSIATIPLVPPPPEKIVPDRKPSREPEGEAAPPNVRSTPVEVVAPPPRVVLVLPPPIVVATVAGSGPETTAGAAEVPGPGQGAGGLGNGRGSGGAGDGTGGGLGDDTPPRRIRGSLRFSDATKVASWETVIGREMTTEYIVGVDGRVSECTVTRSSGLPAVDTEICRLIEERFRYRPARDAMRRPIRSGVIMDHSWDQQR